MPPAWRGITAGVLPLLGSHVAHRYFKTKARPRKGAAVAPSRPTGWIECTTEVCQSPPITAAAAPTSGRSASAPPAPPSRTPCPQQAPTSLRIGAHQDGPRRRRRRKHRRRRCCAPHERELLALVAIGLAVGRRAVGVVVLAGQDSLREVRMLHRRWPEPAPHTQINSALETPRLKGGMRVQVELVGFPSSLQDLGRLETGRRGPEDVNRAQQIIRAVACHPKSALSEGDLALPPA